MDSSENMLTTYQVRLESRPYNYKTRLCKFYVQGHCKQGENCNFIHGEKESVPTSPICKFWAQNGICTRGDNCNFPHPPPPSYKEEVVDVKDHCTLLLGTLYEGTSFRRISIRQFSEVILNPTYKALAITSSNDKSMSMFSGEFDLKPKMLSVFYELSDTSKKGRFLLSSNDHNHALIINKILIAIQANGTTVEKEHGYSGNYTWMTDTIHCKRKHKSAEILVKEAFEECILTITANLVGYEIFANIGENQAKPYKLVYMHQHIEYQNKNFLSE